jgi:DNA-binding transcriptional LysR family regulator
MHRRYDSTNIPIELLRSFVTIAEFGSMTKAAEQQQLTQPAISAQIKRLQQIVGADLLEKFGIGVRPNEQGKMVLRYARRLLALNDQILLHAGAKPGFGSARLGLPPILSSMLLPDILRELDKITPLANFHIECARSAELATRFENGHLDVAVLPVTCGLTVAPRTTWKSRVVWIGSPNTPVSPGKPVPLISWPKTASDQYAIEAFNRIGQSYVVTFVSDNWATVIAAVKAGLGYIAILEGPVQMSFKSAREHYLPALPDMTTGVFVREGESDAEFDPIVRLLARVFTGSPGKTETKLQTQEEVPDVSAQRVPASMTR